MASKAATYMGYNSRNRYQEMVPKIRNLSDEKLNELVENKRLGELLKLGSKSSSARASTISAVLTIAGKKGIRGTKYGDCLKLIAEGKSKEVLQDAAHFRNEINALEIAGILNKETRKINISAAKKCLEANRILHNGEY